MEIIQLAGDDQRLYYLIAHLIMKEDVLNYNLNYPYRTSPEYRWFVATENGNTHGFIPVKIKEGKAVINNYYVANDDNAVFSELLKEVIRMILPDFEIESVTQIKHISYFERCGFYIALHWKRYVKMKILQNEKKRL